MRSILALPSRVNIRMLTKENLVVCVLPLELVSYNCRMAFSNSCKMPACGCNSMNRRITLTELMTGGRITAGLELRRIDYIDTKSTFWWCTAGNRNHHGTLILELFAITLLFRLRMVSNYFTSIGSLATFTRRIDVVVAYMFHFYITFFVLIPSSSITISSITLMVLLSNFFL